MLKIIVFAIVIGLVYTVLKGFNSDISGLVLICGGLLIIGFGLKYILEFFDFITYLQQLTNVDDNLVLIMYKVTSIGLLVEFASQIIEDLGAKSLSNKVEFIGKVMIISISIPVFYGIVNLIKQLII